MIVSAHQPAYLPWLGYFHKMSLCDTFVYYEHVAQSKKDFTARNRVKTSQGSQWLSVPVRKGESTRIQDLQVDGRDWQRVHFKTLLSCYGKATYSSRYMGDFEALYLGHYDNFSDMNLKFTQVLMKMLGLEVQIIRSPDLGINLSKNDGIFQMMEKLGAKKIVFGAHGRDYVDISSYKERGIKCYFQDYKHPEYPQLFGLFEPYMSIVDLIFNCGPNSLSILKSGNKLKSEIEFNEREE